MRQTEIGVMCHNCAMRYSVERAKLGPRPSAAAAEGDSLLLGLFVGFFCGIIGLALVYILGKGPETKRGALYGCGFQIMISVLVRMMMR